MNQSSGTNLLEKNVLGSSAHVRTEEETVNELWKGNFSNSVEKNIRTTNDVYTNLLRICKELDSILPEIQSIVKEDKLVKSQEKLDTEIPIVKPLDDILIIDTGANLNQHNLASGFCERCCNDWNITYDRYKEFQECKNNLPSTLENENFLANLSDLNIQQLQAFLEDGDYSQFLSEKEIEGYATNLSSTFVNIIDNSSTIAHTIKELDSPEVRVLKVEQRIDKNDHHEMPQKIADGLNETTEKDLILLDLKVSLQPMPISSYSIQAENVLGNTTQHSEQREQFVDYNSKTAENLQIPNTKFPKKKVRRTNQTPKSRESEKESLRNSETSEDDEIICLSVENPSSTTINHFRKTRMARRRAQIVNQNYQVSECVANQCRDTESKSKRTNSASKSKSNKSIPKDDNVNPAQNSALSDQRLYSRRYGVKRLKYNTRSSKTDSEYTSSPFSSSYSSPRSSLSSVTTPDSCMSLRKRKKVGRR